MSVRSSAWQAAYQRLRDDFWAAAGSRLRHFRARPIGVAQVLPRDYRQAIETAEFLRESTWAPGYQGMPTYEQAECACLYGDKAAGAQFDRLASLAWPAFFGTPDGKAQYAPTAENDADRWLTVVYRKLASDWTTGPNYLRSQDCLVFRDPDGTERIDHAENYALPMTYGPIRDPDDRPAPSGSFDRWRMTELTTDVFSASAAALDILLADPDPEGSRVVSWQEMDAYQQSPAFQQANFLIDFILPAHDRRFPIYRRDCNPSMMALPSICPKADPKPPVELRPDGDMLAMIEARYRSLRLIEDDQSMHWVGRQLSPETTCTCDLMTPGNTRRPAEWQTLRQLRQAIRALVGWVRERTLRQVNPEEEESILQQGERVAGLTRAAGLELPRFPDLPRDQAFCLQGPASVPVVVTERSEILIAGEANLRIWESEWRAIRIAVEARLAALDPCPLPCLAPTATQVDAREVPLEAPAGTPSPLREAFDAVAKALLQAAEIRQCPSNGRPLFEEEVLRLSAAYNAGREKYAAAEVWLQVVVADDGRCAHQEALNAVCRVNDACGHVMLGIVPFHRATAHILAVPVFDLAELLRAMRRQASRAALQLRAIEVERVRDPGSGKDRKKPKNEIPSDGTLRESRIWLDGNPYRLTTQLREFLSFLILNQGASLECVRLQMGWADNPHVHKRINDLNNKLAAEMADTPRKLHIWVEESCVRWKWESPKNHHR